MLDNYAGYACFPALGSTALDRICMSSSAHRSGSKARDSDIRSPRLPRLKSTPSIPESTARRPASLKTSLLLSWPTRDTKRLTAAAHRAELTLKIGSSAVNESHCESHAHALRAQRPVAPERDNGGGSVGIVDNRLGSAAMMVPQCRNRWRDASAVQRPNEGTGKGTGIFEPVRTTTYSGYPRSWTLHIVVSWYRIPDARYFRVMRAKLGRLSMFESRWVAWCDAIRVLIRVLQLRGR